jgi:probable F420-dependent oxidoreductase
MNPTPYAPPAPTNLTEDKLRPQAEDISIFVIAGRTWSPSEAIRQGDDAERLGFRRVWLSERYDLKEAGAILGGIAARTSRLGIASGIVATGSRSPLMTAAMAATLQATYGHRFVLGLGRSSGPYLQGQGMEEPGYDAFGDYFDIVRRLLRGEVVDYDGPAGSFHGMQTVDPCPGEPPELWASTLGGPIASKLAARAADGTLLVPFLTTEAVSRAVKMMREERERVGLDPEAFRVCHPIVTAPNLDDEYTLAISAARFVTYIVGMPVFSKAWIKLNDWDPATMQKILDHPQFSAMARATADQSFHREELLEPARLVPKEWMESTCAIGTIDECVAKLKEFREAGADELALYGSTPADNGELIDAWRGARVGEEIPV